MKKVCPLLLVLPLLYAAVWAAPPAVHPVPVLGLDTSLGALLRVQQGSAAFSHHALKAELPFRYGCATVAGGRSALLSNLSGATAELLIRHGSAALEAGTQNSLCAAGIRAGLTEGELNKLRIRLPAVELIEEHVLHRFYHAGVSAALPVHSIRYDGDWYWGKIALGLHDLGSFIAQPSLTAAASVHTFQLTKWYRGRITAGTLQAAFINKNGESIAAGQAKTLLFQNTVFIPITPHGELSLSASYLKFSGVLSVRLTAENQGYFFFPYRFYNLDIGLQGSALGGGISYRYTAERLRLYGSAQFYSVVHAGGSDTLHSKEKKSLLFKGKEEKASTPMPDITGSSLVILRLSLGFALSPRTELSAGKLIPIPIFSPGLAQSLDKGFSELVQSSALIIDPLVSGTSIRLCVTL